MTDALLRAEGGHRYGTHLIDEAYSAHVAWHEGVAPASQPIAYARMAAEQLVFAARALLEIASAHQLRAAA